MCDRAFWLEELPHLLEGDPDAAWGWGGSDLAKHERGNRVQTFFPTLLQQNAVRSRGRARAPAREEGVSLIAPTLAAETGPHAKFVHLQNGEIE
jgi:hypothetical protein